MSDAEIKPNKQYGIFKTRDIENQYQELRKFSKKWEKELDREVNMFLVEITMA